MLMWNQFAKKKKTTTTKVRSGTVTGSVILINSLEKCDKKKKTQFFYQITSVWSLKCYKVLYIIIYWFDIIRLKHCLVRLYSFKKLLTMCRKNVSRVKFLKAVSGMDVLIISLVWTRILFDIIMNTVEFHLLFQLYNILLQFHAMKLSKLESNRDCLFH